ncbi:hypothetical protein T36_0642 [Helicobacter cinaedi]|uniref:hypothetical protein n=1 Tax=Helicobacter cinaedi TaxID=213 RepID=UPI001F23CAC2|nr:hypothetical protein [Helicobacter cinaedi]BDB64195.1 hypothetical protein T36_0642 [Helicobacter cinaedi]
MIFGTTADLMSSSAPKITQNNHSPTANLRILFVFALKPLNPKQIQDSPQWQGTPLPP